MSKNKYKPQVWVLPEDDANGQIAEGFRLEPAVRYRNIVVLPPAGGWAAIRDSFERENNREMQKYPQCLMVLLVDFDGKGVDRLKNVISLIEPSLRDRVFVLGAHGEPEKIKLALGSYERIGKALAKDCVEGTNTTWAHPLLQHNSSELTRM